MAKLTDKQELFACEFISDLNATQAAIRAEYSEKSSRNQGARMMSNDDILTRIAELKAERNEEVGVNAAYVLRRLVEIDQMDVLDILLANGELKPMQDWPKTWRTTLSGMDVIEMAGNSAGLLKKIKWPDKVKNLELLGKHVSVQGFRDKLELSTDEQGLSRGLNDFYADFGKTKPQSGTETVLDDESEE